MLKQITMADTRYDPFAMIVVFFKVLPTGNRKTI